MKINIPFDNTKECIDSIKFSTLYYESVNVLCPENVEGIRHFHSKELLDTINILIGSKIVTIDSIDFNTIDDNGFTEKFLPSLWNTSKGRISSFVDNIAKRNADYVQTINGFMKLNNEVNFTGFFEAEDNDDHKYIEALCIMVYCNVQMHLIYQSICNRQSFISSNDFLKNCLETVYTSENKELVKLKLPTNELIAQIAIPILLPNFYHLEFADILDLRHFAKDELEEMRHYINLLSLEYSPDDKKFINIKILLRDKINPSIKQLENKIYGLRAGAIQRSLQSLKNPLAYTPMLTTLFTNIPSHVALAVSMGLIAAESGIDYLKQKKDIETDPLFFSIKLRNIANNRF